MIKGKLALLTCALTLALTSPLLAAQNVSEGQTLKLAIGPEPTEGFDPMLGWSHGSYLLLHAPLLKQNADMSWGNLLTEKVETSADGKTWTLTLKPDLKFSDGSPLTAEDVVFTYNKAAKSGGKIDMGNFTHASLKDNRTVEITLRSPQSTFVNVLGSLGIVPQKRYDEKTFAKNPIGAGPYRLVSFQPGQQLIVEANPWYAGKKNDFSKLVFVFLDEDNAYAAARSGQLGLVRIAPSMAVAPQQQNLKLWVRDSVENRGIVFPMVPAGKKDANGNYTTTRVGTDFNAGVEGIYLTTRDSATEFSLVNEWQIYKNLRMNLEGHYVMLNLDTSRGVWGRGPVASGGWVGNPGDDPAWRDALLDRIRAIEKQLEDGAWEAPVRERVVYASDAKEAAAPKPKPELPQALNEDVKAVAKDFRMIINEASPMLRTYLKKARLSAGEGNRLLIVLPDELSASAVATPEHKEEIQSLIEQKIGKKVEIDVRQMEAGRRFEDNFVDLENLINMEITVEDE